MFKFAVVILALIACAAAKPGLLTTPLAYTAPAAVVAAPAPIVTATSNQYIARNYNGIATAPVVAPVIAKTISPLATHFTAAYTSPLAYSAPLSYAAGPVLF